MEDVVARGRRLIGVRFRPQGRAPEHGLDCVGLVAAAHRLPHALLPADYRLRCGDLPRIGRVLADLGFAAIEGDVRAGDLMVMRTGPGQAHLGLWTGTGLLHADAGLGRVVERGGPPPWPVMGRWRRAIVRGD